MVDDKAPEASVVSQEEEQAVARAVGQLPERYRQVIHERIWKTASFPAIGFVLGISTEAARKLYSRGIAKLRVLLDRYRPV